MVLRNEFYTTDLLFALVDSGADYAIFPYEFSTQLKLDMTTAIPWKFSGTTGKEQTGYRKDVTVQILDLDDVTKCVDEIRMTCAFCEDFDIGGGGLLGQNGFFSLFRTTFHQPSNFFEIDRWQEETGEKK